jgi:mono/diheme cytochrome c family protein
MRAMSGLTKTVTLAACAAFAVTAVASAQSKPRTVWDGVYTDAQAERARATFDSICSNCHTLAPGGNTRGGALSGDKFWTAFTQKSVGDLLTFVKTNMPNGNGGSLSASTYNDLVALVLKSNGFPTGTAEVAPESVADVQIIPKDGPGELPGNVLARIVGCLAKDGNDWVLTSATAPERVDRVGVGPTDATRALGTRSIALKFVLTKLDPFVGQRMSASGMLIGAGGADGINVTSVNRVAETCP